MRYLIKFSYDGTNYHGYQCQEGLDTVQERLENAVKVVNNNIFKTTIATGRTDKGVHAKEQYAHVDLDIEITEEKLKKALNTKLPNDIYYKYSIDGWLEDIFLNNFKEKMWNI